MAAIVYQTCNQTGITYAYESIAYWDKSKQQSRAQRKLLGRVDPLTKEIVPTRKRKPLPKAEAVPERRGPVPATSLTRSFYGATYLFDTILHQLGIREDLQACFPSSWKALLSLSYFMILEDRNSLSRFAKWATTHTHPYGKSLPSQRISELFASITEEAKQHFFKSLWKRFTEKEYWAYNITSISSYGKGLKQLRYGHNKDHELLPQINLALVVKERLILRRTSVSSEENLEGKLFVQFIALTLLSYLQKAMRDKDQFKHYTLQEALDNLDIIECIEQPGHRRRISEMTQKQLDLYEVFGVAPPSSLV